MIQSKVKVAYKSFTQSEKLVAEYILDHKEEVKAMTSYSLAKILGVGQSTIIRFSQKLGYPSYRELLSDISITVKDSLPRADITIDETTQETNEKIVAQYIDISNLTLRNNPPERIDKAVEFLHNAKTIVSFGIGNSNLFAEYFANQLVTIGLSGISSSNSHIILSTILTMKENDVIVLFSESGESKDIVRAAQVAKQHSVKIIALTKAGKSTLQYYADIIIQTINFESNSRLSLTTIRCSQLCLIDMLSLSLLKKDFKKYSCARDESANLLEGYLYKKRVKK